MGKDLLTATLRASARCDASTFGRAEALAARDDFHGCAALILQERGGGCVDCGGLLAECFARLNGDLYLALGVPAGEAGPRVKKSYRRLCLLYHPDKCGGKTTELFHLLQRAWEVLGDDASRARYDRSKPVHVVGARRRASPKTKQPTSDENAPGRPTRPRKPAASPLKRPPTPPAPRPPCKLMVLETACDSATIRWAAGGGESAVSHYHVQFRELFVGRPPEPWPATHQKVKTTACRKKNLAPSYCNEKLASLKGAWEASTSSGAATGRVREPPVYPPAARARSRSSSALPDAAPRDAPRSDRARSPRPSTHALETASSSSRRRRKSTTDLPSAASSPRGPPTPGSPYAKSVRGRKSPKSPGAPRSALRPRPPGGDKRGDGAGRPRARRQEGHGRQPPPGRQAAGSDDRNYDDTATATWSRAPPARAALELTGIVPRLQKLAARGALPAAARGTAWRLFLRVVPPQQPDRWAAAVGQARGLRHAPRRGARRAARGHGAGPRRPTARGPGGDGDDGAGAEEAADQIRRDCERCYLEGAGDHFLEPARQQLMFGALLTGALEPRYARACTRCSRRSCSPSRRARRGGARRAAAGERAPRAFDDAKYLEADAYALFDALMADVAPLYATGGSSAAPVLALCERVQGAALQNADPELAAHLNARGGKTEVLPQVYMLPWLRLLFGRQFPVGSVLWLEAAATLFVLDREAL
ncbi:hypothetical protein JL722_12673 [Aureococcus anophagefferens]|nr:hypothetical protein JL722_12673 [Aureococcus anophagefferens]